MLWFHVRTHILPSQPHPQQFPINFRLDSFNAPRAFYTFNFRSRLLPPPPGNSFGLNVLFALPVGSRSTLAVKLARFIFYVSKKVQSFSNNIHLWDLTFRVDHNHVLGGLQFETQHRHVKVQLEAHFWTNSFFAIDPITHEFISYRMLRGPRISGHAVSTHLRQINDSLKYVQFSTSLIHIFT